MVTPLNELVSRALLAVTRAYEDTDPQAPNLPLLMVGLRTFDDPCDAKTAHTGARVSKRAMVVILKQLQKQGLVTSGDKKAKLTAHGSKERDRGVMALSVAEKKFAALRAPLVSLVDKFELELPHYWITYGTADPSVTGGRYRPGDDGPPRLPPHGADWQPVLRTAKTAADLPLTALLGQALCNFAIDYECQGPPLGWTIHGALAIDPKKGTPMAEVSPFAGLSGDGRSGLERHGVVKVGPKPDQVAKLTPRGQRVREVYAPHTAAVEDRWRVTYGDGAVTKLRAALTKAAPPGPAHPYLDWRYPAISEDSIPSGTA